MDCTSCGAENREDSLFCTQCGSDIYQNTPMPDNDETENIVSQDLQSYLYPGEKSLFVIDDVGIETMLTEGERGRIASGNLRYAGTSTGYPHYEFKIVIITDKRLVCLPKHKRLKMFTMFFLYDLTFADYLRQELTKEITDRKEKLKKMGYWQKLKKENYSLQYGPYAGGAFEILKLNNIETQKGLFKKKTTINLVAKGFPLVIEEKEPPKSKLGKIVGVLSDKLLKENPNTYKIQTDVKNEQKMTELFKLIGAKTEI